jgi:uncharacterized protein YbjT (DUF2867 family)
MKLIVGATGMLGGEICRRLRAAGVPVRALVRRTSDPDRIAALNAMGVELVRGDLQDPVSLAIACAGVDGVVSTAATTLSRQPHDGIEATDLRGQQNLVDAAAAAGVERFIYVSVAGSLPDDLPFIAAKRAVEAHLQGSGLTYTILRPTPFMEVWLGPALGFDWAGGRLRISGAGDMTQSWVSLGDVAEIAVRSLTHPAVANQVVEVGGPESLTPLDVVSLFQEETGRAYEVEHVPAAALAAHRASATDPYEQTFAGLMHVLATRSDAVDMAETTRELGVSLTTVMEYARRTLAPAGG